jgi:hypothetical protein
VTSQISLSRVGELAQPAITKTKAAQQIAMRGCKVKIMRHLFWKNEIFMRQDSGSLKTISFVVNSWPMNLGWDLQTCSSWHGKHGRRPLCIAGRARNTEMVRHLRRRTLALLCEKHARGYCRTSRRTPSGGNSQTSLQLWMILADRPYTNTPSLQLSASRPSCPAGMTIWEQPTPFSGT